MKVLALAGKDLVLLLRDKPGLFFTVVFPLLFAIFFGSIFAGAGSGAAAIAVAVVDEDATPESRAFIETLSKATELKVTRAASRDEAAGFVRRGRQTAFVLLPKGFGNARQRMFAGQSLTIEVGVDPSRKAESGLLQGILTRYAFEGMKESFTNPDAMKRSADSAIESLRGASDVDPAERQRLERFLGELQRFSDRPAGAGPAAGWEPLAIKSLDVAVEGRRPKNSYEISFPQGIIWGVMACAAAFGIGLVVERSRGTLVRLQMSPVSRTQILAGKGLACFAATVGLVAALLAFAAVAFRLRPDSLPLLAVAVLSIATCFVGIMMMLSVVGRSEAAAGGIGWAVLTVMAMIGGGMVPLFVMPSWMQTVSHASPVKWAILALEGAIWRGFTPAEMALPCGILVAVGVACFAAGTRMFRWG